MGNKQKWLERNIAAGKNVIRRAQESAATTGDDELREADEWLAQAEQENLDRNQAELARLIAWKKEHGYPI